MSWKEIDEAIDHGDTDIKNRYTTIAVKFVNKPGIAFTYRVKLHHGLIRGDMVVPETDFGPSVAMVVRIDATPQDDGPHAYKWVHAKVVAI